MGLLILRERQSNEGLGVILNTLVFLFTCDVCVYPLEALLFVCSFLACVCLCVFCVCRPRPAVLFFFAAFNLIILIHTSTLIFRGPSR